MQEDHDPPAVPPDAQVFRGSAPRSHAAWAAVGVLVYWVGLFVIVGPLEARDNALLTPLWFVWQLFGIGAFPWAARRVDEALGARRGDRRPLHRPYVSALGAFIGSVAGVVALGLAFKTLGHGVPERLGAAVFLLALSAGAYLGARVGALGASERAITLGIDALTVADGRRTTVIALRDIAAVLSSPREITVRRRAGREIAIDLRGTGIDDRALGPAIERAASAAREGPPVGAALRRGDRALDAWREALRAKSLGGSDFRAQALDRGDLEAALVHPGATAEERIGAALALRALDDAGAARVRVAAEAALDPPLREALRAVADGAVDETLVRAATRDRTAKR